MNGHDYDLDYCDDTPDPNDYDGPELTDIECPFCGHYTEYLPPVIYCDNCEVSWKNAAEVERDRRNLDSHAERDEPSDEFMFDRAMSIGRGVLR